MFWETEFQYFVGGRALIDRLVGWLAAFQRLASYWTSGYRTGTSRRDATEQETADFASTAGQQ